MLDTHLFKSDEFLDKKSDFSLLIKNWLNLAFIFLKRRDYVEEQI